MQLEEACGLLLQNLHGVNEDGSKPRFSVQVMLNSSERFGPANVRELSVRSSPSLRPAATLGDVCMRLDLHFACTATNQLH